MRGDAGAGAIDPTVPASWDTLAVLTPPTYRLRLQLEGAALTVCGVIGTVVVLVASSESTRAPASTAVQLLTVAALLLWFGPRGVRRSIARSNGLDGDTIGSGEPTPLWHIAAIVAGLAVIAVRVAGGDAGLRVTSGCALVGAVQAVILAGIVRNEERATSRTYYRVAGSRILRGTRLGYRL